MYQTRAKVTKKIPIPRKGTKYVVRALSHIRDSVPVVIAVRDMLKLARTSKEVKEMIKQKLLKLNGKEVKNHKESIKLFNIFEADQPYVLTFSKNGRYVLEKAKNQKERACKVINKKMLKGKITQLNLHDGSNVISKEKINVQDTIYLDFKGKITKHLPFEKSKECIIISGKYLGLKGKIETIENGKAKVNLEDKEIPVELEKRRIVVL